MRPRLCPAGYDLQALSTKHRLCFGGYDFRLSALLRLCPAVSDLRAVLAPFLRLATASLLAYVSNTTSQATIFLILCLTTSTR